MTGGSMTGNNKEPVEPSDAELEARLQASPVAQAALAGFMKGKSPEEQARVRRDVLLELWEVGAM
jgi:hypothetical protein